MAEPPLTGFGAFSARLAALGFTDKVALSANLVVTRASPRDGHMGRNGIGNIGGALRHATVDLAEKVRFIEQVADKGRISTWYYKEPIGNLARGLFHLLGHEPSIVLSHFELPALKKRVSRELSNLRDLSLVEVGTLLQLWAATELLGIWISVRKLKWPHSDIVNELLTVGFTHTSHIEDMGHIQQQLWMGLRIFARHYPQTIALDSSLLEDALERWNKTLIRPDRPPIRIAWDRGMIQWLTLSLEKSMLVRDRTPLWLSLTSR
jgi:hypothetical protein